MLNKQLREAWLARERSVPITPILNFAREGLVLGAGTVLVPAEGPRWLRSLKGQEAHVLALLSTAYGRAVAPAVLGNIERAARSWSEGDDCLAYIHLAHSGLGELEEPYAAACRLFVAEACLKAGVSPRAIFQALKIDTSGMGLVEKAYNPAEPRVPAGSGPTSGQWTDSEQTGEDISANGKPPAEAAHGSSLLGRMPPPTPSFMGALDTAQLAELGLYASRLATPVGAATAAFGLLFIPSPNNIRVESEVPEIPGLRYSWNRDETIVHLTYGGAGGAQRTFALRLLGDEIQDEDGNVVGRIIGGNRIAIDTVAVLSDLAKQDEPRLCPAPAPDVAGSDQGKPYEQNRSRQYEDFVKRLINPPPNGPTPSGFVYYLPNPTQNGKPVSYDDCKKTNGILFEIKGEGYTKLTKDLSGPVAFKFTKQATAQLAASGGRPIVWIFAEPEAALFARTLFNRTPGLERITVGYIPWPQRGR